MLKIHCIKGYEHNKYLQQIINVEQELFTTSFKAIYTIDDNIYYKIITYLDNVIAYVSYKDLDDSYDIIKIGVLPLYQKQGLATMLLQSLMDKDILLEVDVTNYKAYNLYKKLGFNKICDLPHYYQNADGVRLIYKKNEN